MQFKLDEIREEVQDKAVSKWLEHNKIGIVEAITGVGKNFIFIKSVYNCPLGGTVLFLAEQTDRRTDILNDITKFHKVYGKNLLDDYNFTFLTYQSAYKLKDTKWDFVCADECHDGFSPVYSQFFFNNKYTYFIGLSATIMRNTSYAEDGVEFSKGDIMDMIAPVCFRYTIDEGQEDGTSRKLDVTVIEGVLDGITRNIKAGTKLKPFYTTELANYEYWDKEFKKSLFIEDENTKLLRIRITSAARAKVLYKLPSKVKTIKKLLPRLKGKTLLFGNDLDTLLEITPNVICSRHSDKKNNEIRDKFENGSLNLIGSFKKLKQGANLSGLDNIVITSYYSTTKDLIQRLGRLRKDGDKIGNVYILLTKGTQEEKWFDKMLLEVTSLKLNYIKADEL
jgi:superfamily II DNA or RNA helicase